MAWAVNAATSWSISTSSAPSSRGCVQPMAIAPSTAPLARRIGTTARLCAPTASKSGVSAGYRARCAPGSASNMVSHCCTAQVMGVSADTGIRRYRASMSCGTPGPPKYCRSTGSSASTRPNVASATSPVVAIAVKTASAASCGLWDPLTVDANPASTSAVTLSSVLEVQRIATQHPLRDVLGRAPDLDDLGPLHDGLRVAPDVTRRAVAVHDAVIDDDGRPGSQRPFEGRPHDPTVLGVDPRSERRESEVARIVVGQAVHPLHLLREHESTGLDVEAPDPELRQALRSLELLERGLELAA